MTVIEHHFPLNATKSIRSPQISLIFHTEFEVQELKSKHLKRPKILA